ncbi:doublecortin domain-containing protein 1-like isoform X2 [Salvelinus alpinus]|uniref:doublecortin domain-containing protein 1-like isoform X2 n=1 Tax=Salvelinus alpinus TaxID=8036 RepID=UPI0039FC6F0E
MKSRAKESTPQEESADHDRDHLNSLTLQQRGRSITQAHRQQFKISKGQMDSSSVGQPSAGIVCFHDYNPPQETPAPLLTGCSVVLQKYKPYSYGAANQKWGWFADLTVLSAFYTSSLDQEVTAANQASVCTACVSPEPLHQQGFSFTRSGVSGSRVKVCPSCSTGLRGRGVLQKLPPGSSSLCCMASHNHQLSPTGHFRILKVHQTELSESAADVTLQRLDECLGVTEDGGCGAAGADAVPRGVQRSPDQAEREAPGHTGMGRGASRRAS